MGNWKGALSVVRFHFFGSSEVGTADTPCKHQVKIDSYIQVLVKCFCVKTKNEFTSILENANAGISIP